MEREFKEHYATEAKAEARHRELAAHPHIPGVGTVTRCIHYRENTEATLSWCVRSWVQES